MDGFRDYIDASLPDRDYRKDKDLLYKFKRKTLDEMNRRFDEASSRGVRNDKVFTDLIESEHPDLKKEFNDYYKKELSIRKAKRNTIINAVGSVIYILVLLVTFLGVSFSTHDWAHTWVIMVDGILLLVAYLLTLGVIKITEMKRIFHFIARIMLAMEMMVLTVAAFIFSLAILHLPDAWAIVIGGLALMFIADAIYAVATHQRLAVLNFLFYIPSVATMVYVMLGATGVLAWGTGWILIIIGLIADFGVVVATVGRSKIRDKEAYDSWQED